MDKSKSLTPEQLRIIQDKATEAPGSGDYNTFQGIGSYLCRRCGLALFRSDDKFLSACGWPSFDNEIDNAIKRETDRDGRRTEILCNRCNAHLGHVFSGEYLTNKNLRHCVNSAAIDFVNSTSIIDSEEAIFAGGCFWGIQHLFEQFAGIVKTEVGYIGGDADHPSYEMICRGDSGHYEATRIVFDSTTDYEAIAKFFFEIHDATQGGGQGPDIGQQYQSAIFYFNEAQLNTSKQLIATLEQQGLEIKTKLLEVSTFWAAEQYHQHYYQKTGNAPYCHSWTQRFSD